MDKRQKTTIDTKQTKGGKENNEKRRYKILDNSPNIIFPPNLHPLPAKLQKNLWGDTMTDITTKLYENGKIALRKPLRQALGVRRGDIVTIQLTKHPNPEKEQPATITSRIGYRGMLHIPKIIREALKLNPGDLVDVEVRKASRRPPY